MEWDLTFHKRNSQVSKTKWEDWTSSIASSACVTVSHPCFSKAALMAEAACTLQSCAQNAVSIAVFIAFKQKGGRRAVIPVPLPHGPGIPIYTLSCSSILVTRDTQGHAQSSRDGPPAPRRPEPPSRDPCKMSVDRTHRRRRPHCCTCCTGATGTPTFLVRGEGGREEVVSAWGQGSLRCHTLL